MEITIPIASSAVTVGTIYGCYKLYNIFFVSSDGEKDEEIKRLKREKEELQHEVNGRDCKLKHTKLRKGVREPTEAKLDDMDESIKKSFRKVHGRLDDLSGAVSELKGELNRIEG